MESDTLQAYVGNKEIDQAIIHSENRLSASGREMWEVGNLANCRVFMSLGPRETQGASANPPRREPGPQVSSTTPAGPIRGPPIDFGSPYSLGGKKSLFLITIRWRHCSQGVRLRKWVEFVQLDRVWFLCSPFRGALSLNLSN